MYAFNIDNKINHNDDDDNDIDDEGVDDDDDRLYFNRKVICLNEHF